MFLGEHLKDLRINKKLSQDKLGSLLEVSKVTISNWETGKSVPSEANLERIAKVFDVDVHYFYSYGELLTIFNQLGKVSQELVIDYASQMLQKENRKSTGSVTKYPYKTYSIDSFIQSLSDTTTIPNFTLAYHSEKKPYQFALWIQDDSLEPKFSVGEVVLLKFAEQPQDGQLYLVEFKGKAMFRQVYTLSSYLKLVPYNSNYDTIFAPFEENPRIIAKVVGGFRPIEK